MPSLAENGSKSLKGGRTVREGASMSGTAAADLEREEEASSAGLSARCAAQASSASWRGIAYSENAIVGALYLVAGVRPRNAPTQRRKE